MVKDSLTERLEYMVYLRTKDKVNLTNDELREIYTDCSSLLIDQETEKIRNTLSDYMKGNINN